MYNERFSHMNQTFGSQKHPGTTIKIGYIELHQGFESLHIEEELN